VTAFVSLNSPSCGVPCLILLSVVYRDVTRQAKGLYRLKHAEACKWGLTYFSRCNSSWFCHIRHAILTPPPLRGPWSACIRAVPSAAFSSTASNVHHARPSCTPTRSRPELAQREHRHALHAAALHVVALHSSSFSCCRTRTSNRPCRVAGPSAAVLAKLPPCAASLPSMRVYFEPPRFSSIRASPRHQRRALPRLHARRSVTPTLDAAPLACPSPAPTLQRLHSSALRAVRSRTRRHITPAPASVPIPALPRVCAEPNHLCSRRPALRPALQLPRAPRLGWCLSSCARLLLGRAACGASNCRPRTWPPARLPLRCASLRLNPRRAAAARPPPRRPARRARTAGEPSRPTRAAPPLLALAPAAAWAGLRPSPSARSPQRRCR
jgi:hypothetical protein